MNLIAAVEAAAPGAPAEAAATLLAVATGEAALATPLRAAHLIGQCAHESLGFTRVTESLSYSTAARLMAVWPSRFPSLSAAEIYVRNPVGLAEHVYGGRMGNRRPGDGYRYRGRGWLQLTGRANYIRYGETLGIDLEAQPDRAAEPATAWRIAALYFESHRRMGQSALEWADLDNAEMVTRIVNGGLHGLDDRRHRTAAALAVLTGAARLLRRGDEGAEVLLLQRALAAHGFSPGALDGDFGLRTQSALEAFQRASGLTADGIAGPETRAALIPRAA